MPDPDFFCIGLSLLIFDRFGDVQTGARFTSEWEAVQQQIKTVTSKPFPYLSWGCNRLEAAPLRRMIALMDMQWRNVKAKIEELPENKWSWKREDGERTTVCQSSGGIVLLFQLLILTKLSGSAQKSEAAYFVEELSGVFTGRMFTHHDLSSLSGVPYFYFEDRDFEVNRFGMPLYMHAAKAAENLKLGPLAVQYAHKTLAFHKNPVKTYYGHARLGEFLVKMNKHDSDASIGRK